MKRVMNITLTGRKDEELKAEGNQPLTTFILFKGAAMSGPANKNRDEVTTVIWRKCNKALDAIESAEETKAEYVDIEDDWYDILRPTVEKIILNFGHHSPYIEDALKGAVTDAPKEVQK